MIDDKYLTGDPKLIWQDQIAGAIDYDSGPFLGALSDLQCDPDWREAFSGIATEPGVPEFLERLQRHFDLCLSPHNEDGSVSLYQHPSRTQHQDAEKGQARAVELMERCLRSVADMAQKLDDEDAALLQQARVVWTADPEAIAKSTSPTWSGSHLGDVFREAAHEMTDETIEGAPKLYYHLTEACYGLAASYDLQRHLMRSFYTRAYDTDALYEAMWECGCDYFFGESECFVYDAAAFWAWEKAQRNDSD